MARIGKRVKAARDGVDRERSYPVQEAVKMVKERAKAKFDETIEMAMNLGDYRLRQLPYAEIKPHPHRHVHTVSLG